MSHICRLGSLLLAVLFLVPTVARGADLLAEVPHDALGFVVVHNLSSVDARIGQLATLLERSLPRPLAFLKEFGGVSDGLNADGDTMLVLFPANDANHKGLQYCLWLPISDYDRFLKSLNATAIDGVAAATIAGEDLVIAHRGDWALIMDPDQRDRISELADAAPATPELPPWKSWISENDVAFVAFTPGVQILLDQAAPHEPTIAKVELERPGGAGRPPIPGRGRRPQNMPRPNRTAADVLENARLEFQKWYAVSPQFVESLKHARVVGCGVRLDGNGNVVASVRVALDKNWLSHLLADKEAGSNGLPFALYGVGGFVTSGAGHVPPSLLTGYAKAYARYIAADLKSDERTELDETAFNRLLEATEPATADVQSFAVLNQPGEEAQPVYSNNFVAVRVKSSSEFAAHVREVMRLWNSANRDAKGETKLVFDVEDRKLGDRTGTLYSLDVAALEGGPVAPETRQAMEKLFGPEGKLRLWIVPTDDTTVLLAAATLDQMTATLKVIDQKRPIEWGRGELSDTNSLLPAESDWRVFVDPHRYFDWQRREMMAIIGVPVIGGPLVKEFPASPPIGIAGGFREGELWADAAALAPTLKSADAYLTRGRGRATIQIRPRVVPRQPVPAPR